MIRSVAKSVTALILLVVLAACAVQPPDSPVETAPGPGTGSSADALASGAICRVGPDGGPLIPSGLLSDRGIGGTGGPATVQVAGGPATVQVAGGPTTVRVADRGIGGTGIVGVITGFASVCVDGLEVQYDETATVDVDGSAASAALLRVGQVVVIQANGSPDAARARTISVRSEVAGRIEAVELGSGMLTIGGQPVTVASGTWGADRFTLGDWVTVSGLRRPDGVIVASRLDAAPTGSLVARGQVTREGGVARIGGLVLQAAVGDALTPGQFVTAAGSYSGNKAQVRSVVADTGLPGPAGYFGSAVDHIVMQAFVRVENGAVWMNGVKLSAGPGVRAKRGADGVAIVSLEKKQDGSYTATGLRFADHRNLTRTGGAVLAFLPTTPKRTIVVPSRVDPVSAPAASSAPPVTAVDPGQITPPVSNVPSTGMTTPSPFTPAPVITSVPSTPPVTPAVTSAPSTSATGPTTSPLSKPMVAPVTSAPSTPATSLPATSVSGTPPTGLFIQVAPSTPTPPTSLLMSSIETHAVRPAMAPRWVVQGNGTIQTSQIRDAGAMPRSSLPTITTMIQSVTTVSSQGTALAPSAPRSGGSVITSVASRGKASSKISTGPAKISASIGGPVKIR